MEKAPALLQLTRSWTQHQKALLQLQVPRASAAASIAMFGCAARAVASRSRSRARVGRTVARSSQSSRVPAPGRRRMRPSRARQQKDARRAHGRNARRSGRRRRSRAERGQALPRQLDAGPADPPAMLFLVDGVVCDRFWAPTVPLLEFRLRFIERREAHCFFVFLNKINVQTGGTRLLKKGLIQNFS